jgi:hypothetical protein
VRRPGETDLVRANYHVRHNEVGGGSSGGRRRPRVAGTADRGEKVADLVAGGRAANVGGVADGDTVTSTAGGERSADGAGGDKVVGITGAQKNKRPRPGTPSDSSRGDERVDACPRGQLLTESCETADITQPPAVVDVTYYTGGKVTCPVVDSERIVKWPWLERHCRTTCPVVDCERIVKWPWLERHCRTYHSDDASATRAAARVTKMLRQCRGDSGGRHRYCVAGLSDAIHFRCPYSSSDKKEVEDNEDGDNNGDDVEAVDGVHDGAAARDIGLAGLGEEAAGGAKAADIPVDENVVGGASAQKGLSRGEAPARSSSEADEGVLTQGELLAESDATLDSVQQRAMSGTKYYTGWKASWPWRDCGRLVRRPWLLRHIRVHHSGNDGAASRFEEHAGENSEDSEAGMRGVRLHDSVEIADRKMPPRSVRCGIRYSTGRQAKCPRQGCGRIVKWQQKERHCRAYHSEDAEALVRRISEAGILTGRPKVARGRDISVVNGDGDSGKLLVLEGGVNARTGPQEQKDADYREEVIVEGEVEAWGVVESEDEVEEDDKNDGEVETDEDDAIEETTNLVAMEHEYNRTGDDGAALSAAGDKAAVAPEVENVSSFHGIKLVSGGMCFCPRCDKMTTRLSLSRHLISQCQGKLCQFDDSLLSATYQLRYGRPSAARGKSIPDLFVY